jgi:hypothetical protein
MNNTDQENGARREPLILSVTDYNRACGPQLGPDRKRIFGSAWISVVEIVCPVRHRGMFGHRALGIGHRAISSARFAQIK